MNILLTGATGYLGSHLAKAFVADGHRVVALKRKTSSLRRLTGLQDKLCFYDIDTLDLARPFKEQGVIDAVVHTATCYGRAGEKVSEVFEANTLFPLRLLEAANYFNTATFFNTDTILHPYINAYSLSKKQFADWGRQLSASAQILFINIRLEHMYGPGDDRSKFTTWIVERCVSNAPTIDLTAGDQLLDFIYVDDVVAAYRCLLKHSADMNRGYQELGLGTGSSVRLREFVEMVHRFSDSSAQLRFGVLPYREHEIMQSHANTRKLQNLGWKPFVDLPSGLKKMINFSMRDAGVQQIFSNMGSIYPGAFDC